MNKSAFIKQAARGDRYLAKAKEYLEAATRTAYHTPNALGNQVSASESLRSGLPNALTSKVLNATYSHHDDILGDIKEITSRKWAGSPTAPSLWDARNMTRPGSVFGNGADMANQSMSPVSAKFLAAIRNMSGSGNAFMKKP